MPRVSCYYMYTIVSLTFIFMLLYSIVFGEREVIFTLFFFSNFHLQSSSARYVRLFVAIGSRSRGLGSCCRRYLFRGRCCCCWWWWWWCCVVVVVVLLLLLSLFSSLLSRRIFFFLSLLFLAVAFRTFLSRRGRPQRLSPRV